MNELSPLAIIALFSAVSKAITEKVYKPIRTVVQRFWPDSVGAFIADQLTPYIAWGISGALVWVAQFNLFEGIMPAAPGIIFTAIVSGLGANLLADFFDWPKTLARELSVYRGIVFEGELLEVDELPPCCDKPS